MVVYFEVKKMQFYTESPFYCDGIEICGGGGFYHFVYNTFDI